VTAGVAVRPAAEVARAGRRLASRARGRHRFAGAKIGQATSGWVQGLTAGWGATGSTRSTVWRPRAMVATKSRGLEE